MGNQFLYLNDIPKPFTTLKNIIVNTKIKNTTYHVMEFLAAAKQIRAVLRTIKTLRNDDKIEGFC